MKRLLKKSISFFIATVMVLSIAFFGAAQADENTELYTEVNIVKLNLPRKLPKEERLRDPIFERKHLGTEKDLDMIRESLMAKYNIDIKKDEFKKLSGAKFYVFSIDDYEVFDAMRKNPEKYDTLEKIKKECKNGGELKGHVKYGDTLNEKENGSRYSTLSENTPLNKLKNYGYTNEEGILKAVLKTDSSYFPQHYFWIVEDCRGGIGDATNVDTTYSFPIGVALPMRNVNIVTEEYGVDGGFDSITSINDKAKYEKIYVYPKNVKASTITKEKTVESEGCKYVSIDNYQNFDWFLQANIPSDYFEDITYLSFEDTAEAGAPIAEGEKSELEKYNPEKGNKDRGFVFNANPEDVEVYVKKMRPYENSEDYDKRVDIDKKYFNVEVNPGSTKFKLEFKSNANDANRKDGETVLDINNPAIYGEEHPIFGKGKFNRNDRLTIFVKVNARYSDLNNSGGSDLSKEKKKYSTEANFEEDSNDRSRGINDGEINKYRANDFSLKFSRDKLFDLTSEKTEAEGNLYKPRVNTGAAKFFKYVKEKEGLKGVDKAKFYIRRTSRIKEIENDVDGNVFPKDDKYYKEIYGIEKNEGYEYLAIKDNKKIWIDSDKFTQAKENNGEIDGAKLYSLESKENGLFELRGLQYCDYTPKILEYTSNDKEPIVLERFEIERNYFVEEYMPPEECILNRNHEINFLVGKGTQYENVGEDVEGRINNTHIISGQKDILTDNVLKERRKIRNIKAVIPGTGSRDALYFIIAGVSVLLITYLLYRRKNKKMEKNK